MHAIMSNQCQSRERMGRCQFKQLKIVFARESRRQKMGTGTLSGGQGQEIV